MEKLDYHQRLKECGLYSLERRRERYMIIYGWQQLENIKENVLELKVSNRSKTRRIQLGDIKTYLEDGTRINPSVKTQILNSPARKIERLFSCMPSYLRDITGKSTEFFKRKLDDWLMKVVSDEPKLSVYAGRTSALSNSITDQYSPSNRERNRR